MLTLISMDHLDLTVEHRGVTKAFHINFRKYGWSYRFTTDVNGTEVIFEPDEERNLRAIVPTAQQDNSNVRELVPLIALELQKIFKINSD